MEFLTNTGERLMAIGILLAAVDLLLLGFSTFFLTLAGLATLTTGALVYFNVLQDSFSHIAISIATLTAIYSALLWKPLTLLQRGAGKKQVSSDLIGHEFILEDDISDEVPGSYSYSGIVWKLRCNERLAAGTRVVVTQVQVGVMTIEPVSD